MHNPVAYTYEAAMHCPDCARARFGDAPVQMPVIPFDREGNEVGAVYSWEEGTDGEHCDDCSVLLAGSDRPAAPYAVMCGLGGGYIPNSIYHYETLEDALAAARDDLDRAADHLAMAGHEIEPEESAILEDLEAAIGVIDAATTRGDLSEFEQGFSWQIARYESISLTPISPEDYEASDE